MSVKGSGYLGYPTTRLFPGGMHNDRFSRDQVNPASVDLTVGKDVQLVQHCGAVDQRYNPVQPAASHEPCIGRSSLDLSLYENRDETKAGVWVYPGTGVLLHTDEYVTIPKDKSALVLLKSSRGREFVQHMFAGWVDPGFRGQLVLEIYPPIIPIRIYRGQKIAQLILLDTDEVGFTYGDGTKQAHYQGQTGPVGSWEQP